MPPRRRNDGDPGPSGRGGGGGGGGGAPDAPAAPVHRFAFVQHLMKHGCLSEAAAKDVFARLTGSASDEAYRGMLADQNREMEGLHLQIRTMRYPLDARKYVGLINTHADAPSKLGTRFTLHEREFFRLAMEVIATDDAARGGVGSASSMLLLNMDVRPAVQQTQQQTQALPDGEGGSGAPSQAAAATQPPPMTKPAKEAALRKLVSDGWLKHAERPGHYALGVRTFLELGRQLLDLPGLPDATRDAWQDLM